MMKKWPHFLEITLLMASVLFLAEGLSQVRASKIGDVYGSMTSASLIRASKVSPNSQTTFDILLKPRNQGDMYQEALDVNSPTSSSFKQYLTASGFREKYGQPTSVTKDWQKYLKKYHLQTAVYDNGITLAVSGKVKNMNKLFQVDLNKATYHQDPLQFGKKKPAVPARLSKTVWTVLGAADHNRNYFFPNTQDHFAQSSNAATTKGYTSRFTDHYQVNKLYDQGLSGQGQTVGIIAFAGVKRSNINHFWKHENAGTWKNRLVIKSVKTDHFVPAYNRDDDEATMDTEYSGSVAKNANIRLYVAKSGLPTLAGLVNAYTTAYDENKASALSTSWGMGPASLFDTLVKRKVMTPDYLKVFNFVFAQGALQGISNFIASGDMGAYKYRINGVYKNRVLLDRSVQDADPISTNPWVTSVGGTTLPFKQPMKTRNITLGTITNEKERAWGSDYMWSFFQQFPDYFAAAPSVLTQVAVGSTGGFSHLYETPQYQKSVPGVNTFYARPALSQLGQPIYDAALTQGTDYGRNYPDVAANADPTTGYQVYQVKKKGSSWKKSGGTSVASPQLAGVAAIINSGRQQRMGFWNPQIYQLATQKQTPFTPLNDTDNNSNLYYTGQPNTDYNQASGLGIVNFNQLASVYK